MNHIHTYVYCTTAAQRLDNCDNIKHVITRKPSYRKDDRAMRQYRGAMKNFESRDAPTATFPEICNGLLFRSMLRMCVQNLKFVALFVPEIIGGTEKNSTVPGYAHAPFFPKIFNGLLFGWTL